MDKLLEVAHLTKVFTLGTALSRVRITAVDDISFHIEAGEIFALAGESGCGKSTTARIIMGFEQPTSGAIIHSGKQEAKNEKVWFTEGIQAIFQDPFSTFNPLRPVERYFFDTIKNYKLAKSRQESIDYIDTKLQLVGLTYDDISGRYPSEFSGGQLQRISVARALLTDPKLIIADEPVSMVDASLRMSIVNLFKRLRDELGVSVLYITHDLATAYYVCDHIAIMFRGDIVEMGTVEEVLMEPKHPYTQLLRASIPEADTAHRWEGEIRLTDTEQDEYLRQGCRFAGRCPLVMDICRTTPPSDYDVAGVHVACHLYGDGSASTPVEADFTVD